MHRVGDCTPAARTALQSARINLRVSQLKLRRLGTRDICLFDHFHTRVDNKPAVWNTSYEHDETRNFSIDGYLNIEISFIYVLFKVVVLWVEENCTDSKVWGIFCFCSDLLHFVNKILSYKICHIM